MSHAEEHAEICAINQVVAVEVAGHGCEQAYKMLAEFILVEVVAAAECVHAIRVEIKEIGVGIEVTGTRALREHRDKLIAV